MFGLAVEAAQQGPGAEALHRAAQAGRGGSRASHVEHNTETNETVVRGLSDLHLRVMLRAPEGPVRRRGRYRVRRASPIARPSAPTPTAIIATRSRPAAPASSARCSCGSSRLPRGGGFEFVDEVKGGTIPGQFMPAVEKGVRQVLADRRRRRLSAAGRARDRLRRQAPSGRQQGSRVRRRRARRRSSTRSARRGRRCSSRSSTWRSPRPSSTWATSAAGSPASARASTAPTRVRGGEIVVKAQVPLSELEGYAAELKSVTAGRGRYSLDFSHYEPVPAAGATQAHRRLSTEARRGLTRADPGDRTSLTAPPVHGIRCPHSTQESFDRPPAPRIR